MQNIWLLWSGMYITYIHICISGNGEFEVIMIIHFFLWYRMWGGHSAVDWDKNRRRREKTSLIIHLWFENRNLKIKIIKDMKWSIQFNLNINQISDFNSEPKNHQHQRHHYYQKSYLYILIYIHVQSTKKLF